MGFHFRTLVLLPFLALVPLALGGCAKAPQIPRDRVNVLLITLDTTRADQLDSYGSEDGLTPHLDALAAEGIVFEDAVAPVPLTTPSHASILTGLYPLHHGVRNNGFFRLGDEHTSIAEIFQDQGMATGAILSAYVMKHVFGLAQGFDDYEDDMTQGVQKTKFSIVERSADQVTASGIRWLEENRDQRFFLWLHYFDPHHPYEPPREFDRYGKSPFGKYKGEVAYMDEQIGLVLARLKEMGLYEQTLIVAAGDHGEGFGEHDEYGHGLVIYETTLRVPLIMRLSDIEGFSFRRGKSVRGRVSLVDIAPTLLEILGLPSEQPTDGHSLVPLLEGKEIRSTWPVYAETAQGKLAWHWSQLAALYSGSWKLIVAPRVELYDLSKDPTEKNNLAEGHADQVRRMTDELATLISTPGTFHGSSTLEMDEEAQERLQSLGYVQGSSIPEEDLRQIETDLLESCRRGKNPNDMMEFANLLTTSMNFLQANQPGRALRILKEARALAGEDNPRILGYMAGAYEQLRLYDSAIEMYETILKDHPRAVGVKSNLAIVYHQKGRSTEAIETLNEVIRESRPYWQHHLNLANIHDDLRQYGPADREYLKALELAPPAAGKKDQVRYNMALSLVRRERFEDARALLDQILQERPDHAEARRLLGQIAEPKR